MDGEWCSKALEAQRDGKYEDALSFLHKGVENKEGICAWWLGNICHDMMWGCHHLDEDEWFKKGASLGDPRSMAELALIINHDTPLTFMELIFETSESNIDDNDYDFPTSCASMCTEEVMMKFTPNYTEEDMIKYKKMHDRLKRKVSESDDAYAKYLASLGNVSVWDPIHQQSISNLSEAAENGDQFAQCVLGEHLIEEADDTIVKAGVEWITLSANQGWYKGQYLLGYLLAAGRNVYRVEENIPLAIEWFKKCAIQGHMLARYNISCLYVRDGYKNEAAAAYWSKNLKPIKRKRCVEVFNEETSETEVLDFTDLEKKIEKCRDATMELIAIWKFRQSNLSVLSKDVITLLAKYVWSTREDEIWMEDEKKVAWWNSNREHIMLCGMGSY